MSKRECVWPNCTATTRQPFSDGWSYGDAGLLGMPEEGYLCPRHSLAWDALDEQPPTTAEH